MSIESTVAVARDVPNKSAAKFSEDLSAVNNLQDQFNNKLGISGRLRLNYNPVLERANYERLKTDDRRLNFRNYELWQVQTALRERNHAAKSAVNYIIDEAGYVRNELFPDEPFSQILERGLAYQEQNGSAELARESDEYYGWAQVCEVLKHPNTPDHAKAIVISGPGIVEGTNYHDNFVDIYEALDDPLTRRRYIRMTRNASKLTYGDYESIASELQPGYFNRLKGPIDAWYLGHTIYKVPSVDPRTTDEIFEQIFGRREGAMNEQEFQELWEALTPVAMYYINVLCQKDFEPTKLAIAWNAVLKISDLARQNLDARKKPGSLSSAQLQIPRIYGNIQEAVNWYGRQEVETVLAACGPSGGFKIEYKDGITSVNPVLDFLSNSVGKFGLEEDKYGSLHFDCPHCNKDNKRPYGELITKCQNCKKDVTCGSENKDKESITK